MKSLLIILPLIWLYSCSSDEGKAVRSIDTTMFNTRIDSAALTNELWVSDPNQVVLKYMESVSGFSKSRNINMRVINSGEVATEVYISVRDEGLLDDSVDGELRIFQLKRTEKIWHINQCWEAWKCQSGRGAFSYDTIPCS